MTSEIKEYINIQTKEKLDMKTVETLKDNAMLKTNPELFEIWDFNENTELDIYKVTRGSGKTAQFYCNKCKMSNHQIIKNKTKGIGCPTCSGYYISNANCLEQTHPEISKTWHPTKNGTLTPKDVSRGKETVVWWIEKCGHEFDMDISSRTRGRGCPYCAGKRVSTTINSLSLTHPEIHRMLENPEDGFNYSKGSDQVVDFICDCGNKINKTISTVVSRGLACPKCKDGLSFGEKVMYCLLREYNIDFLYDSTTDYSDGRRYDFIVPCLNMIIEIDGEQHSRERKSSFSNKGRTLKEEQVNDKHKKLLAKENGNEHYYSIDSIDQDFDFLYNNIEKSGVLSLLGLKKVDKNKINAMSRKSIVFEVCEFYNENDCATIDIVKEFKVSEPTVRRYLKIGNQLNLCDYTPKNNKLKKNANAKLSRKVVQLSLSGEFVQEHQSFAQAYTNLGYKKFSNLAKCCQGEVESCVGFKWMYKEDYDKMIENK